MSDHSQHINPYTAADIQRYLNGNMSATEMHAMEKAALDDPFLADAIEGMEQAMSTHQPQLINQHLQEIKEAVESKNTSKSKVITITWWKFAAAAVVVVVAGLLLWDIRTNNEQAASSNQELAVTEQKTIPDTTKLPQAAPSNDHEGFVQEFNTADAKLSEKNKAVQPHVNQNLSNETPALVRKLPTPPHAMNYSIRQHDEQAAKENIPLDTNIPAQVAPEIDRAELVNRLQNKRAELNFRDTLGRAVNTEVVSVMQNRAAVIQAANPKDKQLSNVIRGRVTDNFFKPIPNAQLQTDSPGNTWFTDREGNFQIPFEKPDSLMQVSVGATGYDTQQFQLNKNITANQLQLQPVQEYRPKGVMAGTPDKKGANLKRREDNLLDQNAEPVYGWIGFEKYLKENIRKPQGEAAVPGKVLVSFVVNRKGELSNFTILRSLSEAADKEAVRLIKEGPSWKLKKGRKATTTVIVHF